MNCPHCKGKIEEAGFSEERLGWVCLKKNKIKKWKEKTHLINFYCPECCRDITEFIKYEKEKKNVRI